MIAEETETSAELSRMLVDAGKQVLERLLDRHLPRSDRGFVGDDAPTERIKPDPYRVLGLKRTATETDIKKRVRELAKIYHPDVERGDADKMAEINDAAAAILSDRKK